MANDIFGELVDWWKENNGQVKHISFDQALLNSLISVGVMLPSESIANREVILDWHQDSEETYESIVSIDIENQERVRTVLIAGYAVVTPPGIPIEEVAEIWRKRGNKLSSKGVNLPKWFLVWRGTIYVYYPPYNLTEYLNDFKLDNIENLELAQSLRKTLKALADLSIQPLGLTHSLRTNGLEVYFCGMGFNVGESIAETSDKLLEKFEKDVLRSLPESFRASYSDINFQ